MKRGIRRAAVIMICSIGAIAPGRGFAAAVPVIVNGVPIAENDLINEIDIRINAQAAADAEKGLTYDESSRLNTRAFMREDVLHLLIERQLITDQLKIDHCPISDADVNERFVEEAKRHQQTPEQAAHTIQQQGETVQSVKEGLRQTLGVERLYRLHASDSSDPTEVEVKQFYDTNPHYFELPEERRVSRILFRVAPDAGLVLKQAARARAEAVRQRLAQGENFSMLARTCSEDTATRSGGGDRGWSPRGWVASPDADPFGNVAFAMKQVGDISPVVPTQDGFDIIQLTGLRPERLPPFDQVKDRILADFRNRKIGTFWQTYAAGLWKLASIIWSADELALQAKQEQQARQYQHVMETGTAQGHS